MNYSWEQLRGDLSGGVTTAIVALPVALAFGIATGLGPVAGLYSAIAVGFFALIFNGTPGQVSGPTPAMTIAMAVVVTHTANNLGEAFTIVMLAGLVQVALGVMRIGRFIIYTPYSVISGFMSGIGIIIVVMQILPILGFDATPAGLKATLSEFPVDMNKLNLDALILGSLTIIVASVWPNRLNRYVPKTLAALVIGSLAGIIWLSDAPVIGIVPTQLPQFQIPIITTEFFVRIIEPVFILAIVGAIDSLLTSLITDSLTRGSHNPNREIMGTGFGNIFSGLIGGLPGAGSTLTTVLNIRAGGRTFVSAALQVALLIAMILGAGWLIEPIPLAVLAGILAKLGWDLIDWRFISRVSQIQLGHSTVMLLTLAITVVVDLVTAVAMGLIAAGIVSARRWERVELDNVISVPIIDLEDDDPYLARIGLVALKGRFSFASATTMVQVINADIRDHDAVIFDFSRTTYMDDSAAIVIKRLIESADEQNKPVLVLGLSTSVKKGLQALNALGSVRENNYFDSLENAKSAGKKLLGEMQS